MAFTVRPQKSNEESDSQQPGVVIRTLFDDIAETGELQSFIQEYMQDRYNTDESFRREMVDTLADSAPQSTEIVKQYVLERISTALREFLDHAHTVRSHISTPSQTPSS
jgi:hypothetical protein